jgi:hypothetical protein
MSLLLSMSRWGVFGLWCNFFAGVFGVGRKGEGKLSCQEASENNLALGLQWLMYRGRGSGCAGRWII